MLVINVEGHEFYDGSKGIFIYTKPITVRLEHSLISISKWESIWKKPYLPGPRGSGISGYTEELSYVSCMLIGNAPEYIPGILLNNYGLEIDDYVSDPYTATTVHRLGASSPVTKTVTCELIYYWMIKFGIPFQCERWHFNRLLTLIDVCNVKENSGKGNNLSVGDSARYRHNINKARRAVE